MSNFILEKIEITNMAEEDLLTRYYLNQAGSGMGDFYSGPIYQKGKFLKFISFMMLGFNVFFSRLWYRIISRWIV